MIPQSGGWAEDCTDEEIVAGIQLLAETEGVFTETAGGVTVAVAQKLVVQGLGLRRIGHTVELVDTPETRGMIHKVRHLVETAG